MHRKYNYRNVVCAAPLEISPEVAFKGHGRPVGMMLWYFLANEDPREERKAQGYAQKKSGE